MREHQSHGLRVLLTQVLKHLSRVMHSKEVEGRCLRRCEKPVNDLVSCIAMDSAQQLPCMLLAAAYELLLCQGLGVELLEDGV